MNIDIWDGVLATVSALLSSFAVYWIANRYTRLNKERLER